MLVDVRDRRAQMDLDADVSQVPHRPPSERLGKGAEDRRRSVEQHDPRLGRIDAPEVAAQRMARQLRELPRELDARRPCTDDDERQEAAPGNGVGLAFGHLERAQDPPAQLERVIDRLHPRRIVRELRMPEVRLARARRDDQAVVGDLAAAIQHFDREAASVEIDGDDLAEHDAGVPLVAQHVAQRRRDVSLGEDPRRDLVEQRLEQVVVGPVDERDVDVGPPQPPGGGEPAEAAADDRHPVPAFCLRAIHPSAVLPLKSWLSIGARDPEVVRKRRHSVAR